MILSYLHPNDMCACPVIITSPSRFHRGFVDLTDIPSLSLCSGRFSHVPKFSQHGCGLPTSLFLSPPHILSHTHALTHSLSSSSFSLAPCLSLCLCVSHSIISLISFCCVSFVIHFFYSWVVWENWYHSSVRFLRYLSITLTQTVIITLTVTVTLTVALFPYQSLTSCWPRTRPIMTQGRALSLSVTHPLVCTYTLLHPDSHSHTLSLTLTFTYILSLSHSLTVSLARTLSKVSLTHSLIHWSAFVCIH